MLIVPPTIPGALQTNLTAAARSGTTITAGATAHTKGAWASLIDPANEPSYGIWVQADSVSAAATVTNFLMDIGYGPTGGGSEEILIPNLSLGCASGVFGPAGKHFFFPVYIPDGVAVRARAQAAIASDTASIAIWLGQLPFYPFACGRIQDYGTDLANSRGTSVAPGNGVFGSWTQLDAGIDRAHRFWACVMDQLGDTTLTAMDMLIELGIGPDAANVSTIFGPAFYGLTASEEISAPFPPITYAPAPAGTPLWARIAGSTVEARGVIAYGMD